MGETVSAPIPLNLELHNLRSTNFKKVVNLGRLFDIVVQETPQCYHNDRSVEQYPRGNNKHPYGGDLVPRESS